MRLQLERRLVDRRLARGRVVLVLLKHHVAHALALGLPLGGLALLKVGLKGLVVQAEALLLRRHHLERHLLLALLLLLPLLLLERQHRRRLRHVAARRRPLLLELPLLLDLEHARLVHLARLLLLGRLLGRRRISPRLLRVREPLRRERILPVLLLVRALLVLHRELALVGAELLARALLLLLLLLHPLHLRLPRELALLGRLALTRRLRSLLALHLGAMRVGCLLGLGPGVRLVGGGLGVRVLLLLLLVLQPRRREFLLRRRARSLRLRSRGRGCLLRGVVGSPCLALRTLALLLGIETRALLRLVLALLAHLGLPAQQGLCVVHSRAREDGLPGHRAHWGACGHCAPGPADAGRGVRNHRTLVLHRILARHGRAAHRHRHGGATAMRTHERVALSQRKPCDEEALQRRPIRFEHTCFASDTDKGNGKPKAG